MVDYFSFRNFRQFERSRRELRLPCDLLNDERFRCLTDTQKAHLLCLLLLAARMDNVLPNRPAKLGGLIGATDSVDLSGLSDFISVFSVERAPSQYSESRPVSDAARAAVMVRDGAR